MALILVGLALHVVPNATALGKGEEKAATFTFSITGETGDPLVTAIMIDALIEIPALGITQAADGGRAVIGGLPTSSDPDCPIRVDVIISADGYEPFTYKNLPVFDGTDLTPRLLRDRPQVDDFTDRPLAGAQVNCNTTLPETGRGEAEASGDFGTLALMLIALGVLLLATAGGSALLFRHRRR
ncbi:MAG: hypothetical protein WBD55_00245 [Dehalococcoidia bacterium]